MNNEEKVIIQKKYASKKFKFLNATDLIYTIQNLILKIHVITGWVLPADEIMNILIDQFLKKITEEYLELNPEEVEFAFRNKGTSLKDWGKEINLNLIDEILRDYLEERFSISKKEENLHPSPEPVKWTNEDILNKYRLEIEIAFQAMRKGYRPIIHIYFEETLRGDEMMLEKENINEFFVRKLSDGSNNLYVKD